jgi:hypothetical protein
MKAKLVIPSILSEITLGQWMQFNALTNSIEDEVFLQEKTVEIFCNIPIKTVRSLDFSSVGEICGLLAIVFKSKPKFKQRFVLDGVEFGMIPQLDSISFGEYIDLDTYFAKENDIDKAMAVLFRPITSSIGNDYLIEPYNLDKKNNMKRMPLDVALAAMDFFLLLNQELLMNTISCLEQETLELTPQQRQDLQKNGHGINHCFSLAEKTFSNLMRSQERNYMSV